MFENFDMNIFSNVIYGCCIYNILNEVVKFLINRLFDYIEDRLETKDEKESEG